MRYPQRRSYKIELTSGSTLARRCSSSDRFVADDCAASFASREVYAFGRSRRTQRCIAAALDPKRVRRWRPAGGRSARVGSSAPHAHALKNHLTSCERRLRHATGRTEDAAVRSLSLALCFRHPLRGGGRGRRNSKRAEVPKLPLAKAEPAPKRIVTQGLGRITIEDLIPCAVKQPQGMNIRNSMGEIVAKDGTKFALPVPNNFHTEASRASCAGVTPKALAEVDLGAESLLSTSTRSRGSSPAS